MKIRVFAEGKMFYLSDIWVDGYEDDGLQAIKVTFGQSKNTFHDDFNNVMFDPQCVTQSTGLKDANDKDLYYGDLIVFYYGWRKEEMVWEVEDITDIEYIFNSVNERGATFEIIGNKFENQYLLEK